MRRALQLERVTSTETVDNRQCSCAYTSAAKGIGAFALYHCLLDSEPRPLDNLLDMPCELRIKKALIEGQRKL